MVMCEVLLGRVEKLLLGLPCELRPALAVGDPAGLFADRRHGCRTRRLQAYEMLLSVTSHVVLVAPVTTVGKAVEWTLAISFQNVAKLAQS